jgi:hypothetical protein
MAKNTYTFVCMLDGQRVAGTSEDSYSDVYDLMTCVNCNHGAGRDCPSINFMLDLKATEQATLITRTEDGVGVNVAYLNKEFVPVHTMDNCPVYNCETCSDLYAWARQDG